MLVAQDGGAIAVQDGSGATRIVGCAFELNGAALYAVAETRPEDDALRMYPRTAPQGRYRRYFK